MTVKELRERLANEDDDLIVIISKDAEGNRYSPLSDETIWSGAYHANNTWSGEAGLDALTDKDIRNGYTDENVIADGVKALFLVPIS